MSKLCGEHATQALFKSQMPITQLWVETTRQKQYQTLIQKAQSLNIPIRFLPKLSTVFPKIRHQGIGAEFEFQYAPLSSIVPKDGLRLLMLDRIQDPHNFGACLRSAAAFGVDYVVVPKRSHAPMSEIVHLCASGGSLLVPIIAVNNLSQTISELKDKGIWFVVASEHANEDLATLPLDRSLCLIMGSEGEGVKHKLFTASDYQVAIPTTGHLSTLNVSVATGILLYALNERVK